MSKKNANMNSKILEHLKGRPIAPIVNASSETNNDKALKLMCIIDYYLEEKDLYKDLEAVPKLIKQLLQLHSFGSFKYFKYILPKTQVTGKILSCKHCELQGPYSTIIEHMVIRHNMHPSAQWCMWCEKTEFIDHEHSSSEWCYNEYYQHLSDKIFFPVITPIHEMLETLADKLKMKINRTKEYKHALYAQKLEYLESKIDDDISNEIFVYRPKKASKKVFDLDVLEKLFQNAMEHFHGAEAHERFSFNDVFQRLPLARTHDDQRDATNGPPKRPRRNASINDHTQANKATEPVAEQSEQAEPNEIDIKLGLENVNCLSFIATIFDDMEDQDLKKQLMTNLKNTAIQYRADDISKKSK